MFFVVNYINKSAPAESGRLFVESPVVVEDHGRLVRNRERWR